MSIKRVAAECLGWYGTLAIVGAYALVSFNYIDSAGLTYQLLNLSGAAGIIVLSIVKNVKQSLVLNIFWAGIAIVALANLLS